MEISEEQRQQAIINARRAKQGKIKCREDILLNVFLNFQLYLIFIVILIFLLPLYLLAIGYSGSVPPHHQNLHQNLHPLHQRHITIPTSVPQQQVFSLAEPPKRKPYHLLYSITRNAFFRKWGYLPSSFFPSVHDQSTPDLYWRLKEHFFCLPFCECNIKFSFVPCAFLCLFLLHVEFQCLHVRRGMTKVLKLWLCPFCWFVKDAAHETLSLFLINSIKVFCILIITTMYIIFCFYFNKHSYSLFHKGWTLFFVFVFLLRVCQLWAQNTQRINYLTHSSNLLTL